MNAPVQQPAYNEEENGEQQLLTTNNSNNRFSVEHNKFSQSCDDSRKAVLAQSSNSPG